MTKAPKKVYLIENTTLDDDDDYRCILAYEDDWQAVYEDYQLVGEYELIQPPAV